MALGEQIVEIAKICFSDDFGCPAGTDACRLGDLRVGPSEAAQFEDGGISTGSLPGANVRNPVIDGLPGNTELCCQGLLRLFTFRICRCNVSGNPLFVS